MKDLIEKINRRFTSHNDVPVYRAHITAEEWLSLKDGFCECVESVDENPFVL